jgi:(1->4)-alpha-D-glucan 1-alpha-D-glucosylmutase
VSALDRLAADSGIAAEYEDYQGRRRTISADTKRALLEALGHSAGSEGAIEESLRRAEEARWSATLAPVLVIRTGRPCELSFTHDEQAGDLGLHWEARLEDGRSLSGTLRTGAGDIDARACIYGRNRVRRRITLPLAASAGYHTLRVRAAGIPDAECALIIVPPRGYVPDALERGERRWGVAVQLYSLRSAYNWGIGDFGDLRRLVAHAADAGADFVGLNPLHALYPARPEHCSPYGPSSRAFLNVLYVDVTAVPEYETCAGAQRLVAQPAFVERLAQLRAAELVDYSGVAELKLPVLRELHAAFRATHLLPDTERGRSFLAFVARSGEALFLHALFDTFSAHFGGSGWREWPDDYRDPGSGAVRAFAREHAQEVELYEYLQWLADEQLAVAQAEAHSRGMLLGLYRDLAVGIDAGGADAWGGQRLYRSGATVGAPPDALALRGQDWGLPAPDPESLRARAYADVVRLLRANMRHCGALRIDHVMALMRLWWVPSGAGAEAGAYVAYPFDDLLGILALESERNRCLVIGEDLGTVPERVRSTLPASGVYSYRVLYFEKDANGAFREPARYPSLAMATVTTHDLPPLVSWWEGSDLALRDTLALFPTPEIRRHCYVERAADRRALLRALAADGLLPHEQDPDSPAYTQMSIELAAAIHAWLARSAAALMTVHAEDLLLLRDAVNVPGTTTEHPNWRRRLAREVDALLAVRQAHVLCERVRAERGRAIARS